MLVRFRLAACSPGLLDVAFLRNVAAYAGEDSALHVPVTVLSKRIREATRLCGLDAGSPAVGSTHSAVKR